MVLVVGILWGLNWTAVKFMMSELPPYTIRAIAFPVAAVILAAISRAQKATLLPNRKELLPLIFTSGFLILGFNLLTSLGQSLTEASQAAIIAYTMPAMTAVLSAFYLKEQIGLRIIVAIFLGLSGLTVLASRDLTALIANPAGPIVMLFAALSWSIGNIALKARVWSLSPAALAAWFFAVATIPCWLLVWQVEWRVSALTDLYWPSTPILLTMAFHIIGPMVICYQLWAVLLKRLPAAVASISVLTAPVVGVLSAVILLGEEMTWHKVIALVLIVTSISITLRKKG